MKILTGNDLASGAVTWWAGSYWSIHVEDAVDVGEGGASTRLILLTLWPPPKARAQRTSKTAFARSGQPSASTSH